MSLQKIQWKIPLDETEKLELWNFFRAFSTWIPNSKEIFIDVVDYRHVQDGTKIILVGHYADVFVDDSDGVPGLVYAQKHGLEGDDKAVLTEVLTKLRATLRRLVVNPIFEKNLKFKSDELYLTLNDRALAPNTSETFDKFKPAIESALRTCFSTRQFQLIHLADPNRRFAVKAISA